jgi:hypothetical protein
MGRSKRPGPTYRDARRILALCDMSAVLLLQLVLSALQGRPSLLTDEQRGADTLEGLSTERRLAAMAETTTVRVGRATRDRLNAESRARGLSVDQLIAEGLDALERERWRRQAEADANRLGADPRDRAEVAAALDDLLGHER